MKLKINIISAALLMIAGSVFTACNSEGDDFEWDKSALFLSGTENNPIVKFVVEDTPASYAVTVQSTKKVDSDVKVELAIDASKVDEYNAANGSNYVAAPEGSVELEQSTVTISAGAAISSAANVKVLSTEELVEGRNYVVPVTMKTVSNGDTYMQDYLPAYSPRHQLLRHRGRLRRFFQLHLRPACSSEHLYL